MAVNPNNLTIDYKTLQAIPFRDRKALLYSSFSNQIDNALTPSQRANLFPSHYQKDAAAIQSAMTGATNLSKAEYLNRARNNAGVGYGDANRVAGTPKQKGPPAITASEFRAVESNPFLAGYADKTVRSPGRQKISATDFMDPRTSGKLRPEILEKYKDRNFPVTIRNNNMGAVSLADDSNKFVTGMAGYVGKTPRPAAEGGYYAKFSSPEHGVAAASKNLENYYKKGINTPEGIVRKWAKGANQNYISTVVSYLNNSGYKVDQTSQLDLSDPNVRIAILKAKSSFESGAGVPVYNDDVYETGVNYAFEENKIETANPTSTPDAMAVVQDVAQQTISASEIRGSEVSVTGDSLVSEDQAKIAATRKQPITPELREVLQYAAEESGVQVEVFSGGQADITQGGPRVGTERHDLGHAADIKLKVQNADGSYRYLSSKNEADREIMSKFITSSRKMGAKGIGSGLGYMGESGIHIGTVVRPDIDYSDKPYGAPAGKESVWRSDSWAQEAFAEGQRQAVEFEKAGGMIALRKAREEKIAKLEEEKKKLAEQQSGLNQQVTAESIQPKSNVEIVEKSGAELLPESHPFSMNKKKKDRIIAAQVSAKPPSNANPTEIAGATATEVMKSSTVPLGTMAQGGTIRPIGDSEIVTRSPTSGEIIQRTKVAEYGAEQIKIEPVSKMNADALSPDRNIASSNMADQEAMPAQQEQPAQKASMTSSKVPVAAYSNIDSYVRKPNSTALRAAMQIRMVNTDRADYIA